MEYMGFGVGALLIAIGAVTYWLAPLVGPNPWFGVRTGYSVASREVWDRTNRVGGLSFVGFGLLLWLAAAVMGLLGIDGKTSSGVLAGGLVAGALAATGIGLLYSRRLAMNTAAAREVAAVPFRWVYVAPVLVSAALLAALAFYYYPQLPVQRLATHFDAAGNANGWMSRDGFMTSFLGLAAVFTLLDVLVVWWAGREPLIAVDRLGSSWWMGPERGLLFMAGVMTFLNLFFAVLLWDTVVFNLQGAHGIPMNMLLWVVVPIMVVVVAGFFLLASRRRLDE